jgi:hypothetical protein
MEPTRRYLFNGSAAAYGGRFVRPDDVVLSSTGGSALSISGGRSVWRDRDIKLGRSFRLRQAETSAEGLVDNLKDAVRATRGQLPAEKLTATTRVSARCRGLEVGGAPPLERGDEADPTMKVAEVAATLVSRNDRPGYESPVIIESATLSTVIFDSPVHGQFKLDVQTEIKRFQKADTRGKVLRHPDIPKKHGDLDMVFSTIVTAMEWQKGREYPGARFIGLNGVHIPNLGAFYFGELIVRSSTRRLVMIQMELGSPTGGAGSVGDIDTNGSWSE